jgi:hypothetical protein
MTQIELIPFIPSTASYKIWHPRDFLLKEDKDGIVTITSPETSSNLTLSSYNVNQEVTENILIDFFHNATKSYTSSSEEKSVITDSRIWLEGEFRRENLFWTWWALSHSNQIILASINSGDILKPEDRHLFVFMLDKMEIYSVDVED